MNYPSTTEQLTTAIMPGDTVKCHQTGETYTRYPVIKPAALNYTQMRAELLAAIARAEALERAIKDADVNDFNAPRCPACMTCTGFERERNCGRDCGIGRKGWQFDQARFSGRKD